MTATDSLQYRVHLAARRPRQAALVVAIIVAGAVATAVGLRSSPLGFLAGCVVIASLSDFFVPIHYRLDDAGVSARAFWNRRYLRWEQVRRVARDHLGVKLSPLARPSRLEAYRGIYLWFAGNEAEVMAMIARHTTREAAGGGDQPPVQLSPGPS